MTLSEWLSTYESILVRCNVKPVTLWLRKYQLNANGKSLGGLAMTAVTTRDIALCLEVYVTENKQTMASIHEIRSLSGRLNEAY